MEAELYAILLNIFSNSIKSVIAKGIRRNIKIIAKREDGRSIINVIDNGIGIKANNFENVFIPFNADPDNRLYPKLKETLNPEDRLIIGTGSGLGLSIVKAIISRRKGTIEFKHPGKGWNSDLEIIIS